MQGLTEGHDGRTSAPYRQLQKPTIVYMNQLTDQYYVNAP